MRREPSAPNREEWNAAVVAELEAEQALGNRPWADKERELLAKHYARGVDIRALSRILRRSVAAIKYQLHAMGVHRQ